MLSPFNNNVIFSIKNATYNRLFTTNKLTIIYEINDYTRFGEHLRSVEEKKHLSPEYQDDDDINIAIHFNLPNHSIDGMGISALLYTPTEKLPRKTLEKKIIFELGTITPSGLINSSLSYFK